MKSFNLSDWALGHRSLVWYFMIAFMAAGLFAYLQLGRQEDPDFTIKTMVIQAQWPGASPEEMTRQVTDRIEKKLEELESLDYTKSVTVAGQTTVFVYLRDTTKAADVAPTWVARPQHDRGHQGRFPARRHRAGLQRSLRRRVRQHLCLHQRRPDPASAARRGRRHPRQGLDRAECRQGRHSRRAGRSDLPRILHPEDRGAWPRHPLDHGLPAGAKRRRAVRRVPGGAGAHQRAGQRPVHVGGKPEGDQSPGQRPLLPADRRRDHHARLCRSADDAGSLQRPARDRARDRHEVRREPAAIRRGAEGGNVEDRGRPADRRRRSSGRRSAGRRRACRVGLHRSAVRSRGHRARHQLSQPWACAPGLSSRLRSRWFSRSPSW